MSAITAGDDVYAKGLWDDMLDQFGKVELGLDLKTGCMTKTNYATVTRINKVLESHGLAQAFEEQLQRLKTEIGARFPILLI